MTESTLTPTPRINLRDLEAIAREARRVYREARAGGIDSQVATRLVFMLQVIAKMHERCDIEVRLARLEASSNG